MNEFTPNPGQTLEHSPEDAAAEKSAAVAQVSQSPATAPEGPVSGNGLCRPKSAREGIRPLRYVWWNSFYAIMEFLNRKLARDPNRKVSWDKWPPYLGLLYLIAKIKFNRSNALTDPYDYASNDTKPKAAESEAARHYY